jgi:hypothetical protein
MPEAIPQLDSFTNSMMMGENSFNFFSLENLGGQTAPNIESLDQEEQQQSRNGHNQPENLRSVQGRSEGNTIDAPSEVVDDL